MKHHVAIYTPLKNQHSEIFASQLNASVKTLKIQSCVICIPLSSECLTLPVFSQRVIKIREIARKHRHIYIQYGILFFYGYANLVTRLNFTLNTLIHGFWKGSQSTIQCIYKFVNHVNVLVRKPLSQNTMLSQQKTIRHYMQGKQMYVEKIGK